MSFKRTGYGNGLSDAHWHDFKIKTQYCSYFTIIIESFKSLVLRWLQFATSEIYRFNFLLSRGKI